jgi:hypothetical protein
VKGVGRREGGEKTGREGRGEQRERGKRGMEKERERERGREGGREFQNAGLCTCKASTLSLNYIHSLATVLNWFYSSKLLWSSQCHQSH